MYLFFTFLQILTFPFIKSQKDSDLINEGHKLYLDGKISESEKKMLLLEGQTTDPTTKAFAQYYIAFIEGRDCLNFEKEYRYLHKAKYNFEKGGIEAPKIYSAVYKNLSQYHSDRGDLDSAEYYQIQRLNVYQDYDFKPTFIASSLNGLAQILYLKKEYVLSSKLSLKSLEYRPKYYTYLYNYFSCISKQSDSLEIDRTFKQLEVLDNGRIKEKSHFYFYAEYLFKNQEYSKSLKLLDEYVIELFKNRDLNLKEYNLDYRLRINYFVARAFVLQAQCYHKLNQMEQEKQKLEQALKYIQIAKQENQQRALFLEIQIYQLLSQYEFHKTQTYTFLDSASNILNTYLSTKKDTINVAYETLMYNNILKAEFSNKQKIKEESYNKSYLFLKKFISNPYHDKDQLLNIVSTQDIREKLISYFYQKYQESLDEKYIFKLLDIFENNKSNILYKRNNTRKQFTVKQYLENPEIFLFKGEQFIPMNYSSQDCYNYFKSNYFPNNKSFLSYYLSNDKLFIITISKNRNHLHIKQLTQEEFSLLKRVKEQLINGSYFISRILHQDLLHLRKLLLPHSVLKNLDNRLVVSSYDELAFIPLEILKLEKEKFVIEKYALSYSFSLFHEMKYHQTEAYAQEENISKEIKVLGIAPFASSNLKFSKQEVENISRFSLLDEMATKNNILSLYKDFDIIHFASHANLANQDYEPKIFLYSDSSTLINEGLTFNEIERFDFSKHQMISLSACYTGNGQFLDGEGIMSMQRAFAYSRAKSVLSCIWKVEDQVTSMLLQNFYQRLFQGEEKDLALQKVKIKYIHESEMAKMNPMFWGGIIISGDLKKLDMPQSIQTDQLILFIIVSISFLFITSLAYRSSLDKQC